MSINGTDLWVCKVQYHAKNGLVVLLQYAVDEQEQFINLVPRVSRGGFHLTHRRFIDERQIVISLSTLEPAVGPLAWQSTRLDLAGIGSLSAVDLARIDEKLAPATPNKTPMAPLKYVRSPEQVAVETVFPEEDLIETTAAVD